MKIKNILAVLSLGMVSCVGLEQYPTTSYTDETFWTIEDNVRTALYLGYNQCWHQDYYFANNLLSDDVYGSRHSTNETSNGYGQYLERPLLGRMGQVLPGTAYDPHGARRPGSHEYRRDVQDAHACRTPSDARLHLPAPGNVVRRRAVLHDQPDAPRIARRQGNARRHDQGVHPLGTCRGSRDPAEKHGYSGI